VVWLTSRLLPNLYVHHFLRDDDDRALQDRPSWAVSFLLRGRYIEHTIAEGGLHRRQVPRRRSAIHARPPHTPYRAAASGFQQAAGRSHRDAILRPLSVVLHAVPVRPPPPRLGISLL